MSRKLGVFLSTVLLPLVFAPGCPTRHFEIGTQRTADGSVRPELTI